MKRLFLLPLSLCLLSCQSTSNSQETTYILPKHDYSEIIDKTIKWNDLFNQGQLLYYVYIYSVTCSHCQNIKDEIISKSLELDNFYFIEYKKDIPIIKNASLTIGMNDIKDIGILGTPTLIWILDKEVAKNLAGEKEILENLKKI